MIPGRRYVYGIPVSSPPVLAPTTMQSSVSQYGITWTFDQPYPVGQFVNGDYFVVANSDATITGVDPAPSSVGGRFLNGTMVNPVSTSQAYDGGPDSNFDSELVESYPLVLLPNSSVVSTRSRFPEQAAPDTHFYVQDLAVLTILSEPPVYDSFRPPHIGEDKPMYRYSDVVDRLHLLGDLSLPQGQTLPLMWSHRGQNYSWARWLARPWPLHVAGYRKRRTQPENNAPDYHGDISRLLSYSATVLLIRDSDWMDVNDKYELIRNYVQLGIDWYASHLRGVSGPRANYWFPTAFAGLMLGNTDMKNMYRDEMEGFSDYHANGTLLRTYHQMGNIGNGTEAQRPSSLLPDRNVGDTLWLGSWFDEFVVGGEQDTWTGYYARTGRRPTFYRFGQNDPDWETLHYNEYPGGSAVAYKRMHSRPIPGFALAALVLDMVDCIGNQVNSANYIMYAYRWMYETESIVLDSYGPSAGGFHEWGSTGHAFVNAMWDEYSEEYSSVLDSLSEE